MTHVELSIKAKQLLDEGVMNHVFDALRQDLLDELLASKQDDSQGRENIYWMLQALSRLEMRFANCCSQLEFDEYQQDNNELNNRRV